MMETNTISVKTALGVLTATAINSPDYPGIEIAFVPYLGNWKRKDCVALIEVDQSEEQSPVLKAHVWKRDEDEPVFNLEDAYDDMKGDA